MLIVTSSQTGVVCGQAETFQIQKKGFKGEWLVLFAILTSSLLVACQAERRKSDAELGLNPQQAAGRRVYDAYCDRCHEPYASGGRQGPSMKGVFKKPYLSISGLPANDERVGDIVRYGRSKMNGFGQVLNQQQVDDLLAYMHTL
jgi:mono/diheme cytochrome c family protein